MEPALKQIIEEGKKQMNKSLAHFEKELVAIRAGKVSPALVEGIKVDYYGVPTPIQQLANITVLDVRTLSIQPFDPQSIAAIEKAIMEANLGATPQNDGKTIRITMPQLTEERRKQLVKKTKMLGEEARIAIRNIRREMNEKLKKLKKEGFAEDEIRIAEQEVQKITNQFIQKIDQLLQAKEKEIMTV